MKRRWLIVTLLVGVLALGVTGGIVLAQENWTSGDSPLKSFVSRVAAILGLDEAQVQDAFDQAATETANEALQGKLDRLVDQGRLTQEQADEYSQWYQSRPETLSPGFPLHGFGGHGSSRGSWGGHGWYGMGSRNGGVAPMPTPESSDTTSP